MAAGSAAGGQAGRGATRAIGQVQTTAIRLALPSAGHDLLWLLDGGEELDPEVAAEAVQADSGCGVTAAAVRALHPDTEEYAPMLLLRTGPGAGDRFAAWATAPGGHHSGRGQKGFPLAHLASGNHGIPETQTVAQLLHGAAGETGVAERGRLATHPLVAERQQADSDGRRRRHPPTAFVLARGGGG